MHPSPMVAEFILPVYVVQFDQILEEWINTYVII